MPVESDADRAAFLDPGEFGATGSYTPAGGAAVGLDGILDAPWLRIEGVAEAPITSASPSFLCRAADLPDGAAQGDAFALGGVTYAVRELRPDGTGMVLLDLERSS